MCVRVGGEDFSAEAVVSTVTTSRFRQLARDLAGEYVERLERIPTIGIFCLLLRLSERVTPFFWVNANDRRAPFAGMIEYTNLNLCLTDYRTSTPTIATPVPNLFLTDSCQLHPHDRTISGSFGLGLEAARLALSALAQDRTSQTD